MLRHELETLGFLISLHPLDRYTGILKGLDYVRARDLHAHVGRQVTTIGWLVTGKTVHTKDGEPMKFVSFEDTTGLMVRTQICLDNGQKTALDRLSAEREATVSDLIRQAVDQFLERVALILRRLWIEVLESGAIDIDLVSLANMLERFVANGKSGRKGSDR